MSRKFTPTIKPPTRRQTLQQSVAVAALMAATGLFPRFALALNPSAFAANTLPDVFKALGTGLPLASQDVILTGPDRVENGAIVPLTAHTELPGVKQMLFLVEKNPSSLIALFKLTPSVEANFATRVKMRQSCDVFAVAVMADGSALFAKKEISVTVGSCGA